MPDKLNVNELRKTLAPCQIRAEQAEFAKQTTTILNAVAAAPARDTVEISDAAREAAGGWEYYAHSQLGELHWRIRGDVCECLCIDGWIRGNRAAEAFRSSGRWRRLTPAEVDELAMSHRHFAREHFAEHQSDEKPDRHLSDDDKMQNILGNMAGALCGGPGGLTESEWDGIRRHFANYERFKDKSHLSQARFAIDRIIYERQQQARKDIADVIRAVLPGGEA